jgi:hypothetical protein
VEKNEIKKVDQEDQSLATQAASPIMQLADKLAQGKITGEQMEKILDVQIKWERNEAKKAYHSAMARFQENAPSIVKSKIGHNCQYADLAIDLVAVVAPKLSEQGLSHKWITESVDGGMKVTCRITHEQGYSEDNSMVAAPDKSGSKNDIQALGSTVTYLQRYTLKAALGLAEGGQGDDGNGAYAKDPPPQVQPPTQGELDVINAICDELGPLDGFVINYPSIRDILIANVRALLVSDKVIPAAEWLKKYYGDDVLYKPVPVGPVNEQEAEFEPQDS